MPTLQMSGERAKRHKETCHKETKLIRDGTRIPTQSDCRALDYVLNPPSSAWHK